MEFANDGDLLQKINAHQQKGLLFQESQIWNIFIQVNSTCSLFFNNL